MTTAAPSMSRCRWQRAASGRAARRARRRLARDWVVDLAMCAIAAGLSALVLGSTAGDHSDAWRWSSTSPSGRSPSSLCGSARTRWRSASRPACARSCRARRADRRGRPLQRRDPRPRRAILAMVGPARLHRDLPAALRRGAYDWQIVLEFFSHRRRGQLGTGGCASSAARARCVSARHAGGRAAPARRQARGPSACASRGMHDVLARRVSLLSHAGALGSRMPPPRSPTRRASPRAPMPRSRGTRRHQRARGPPASAPEPPSRWPADVRPPRRRVPGCRQRRAGACRRRRRLPPSGARPIIVRRARPTRANTPGAAVEATIAAQGRQADCRRRQVSTVRRWASPRADHPAGAGTDLIRAGRRVELAGGELGGVPTRGARATPPWRA
jgi:hypothetical protein